MGIFLKGPSLEPNNPFGASAFRRALVLNFDFRNKCCGNFHFLNPPSWAISLNQLHALNLSRRNSEVNPMRCRFLSFSGLWLLGLAALWSSQGFGATLSECYATIHSSGNPKTQLDQVCLSDSGEVSLYGPNGFRYDFHVDAEFQPSKYRCNVSRHTGDTHCGYSHPSIRLSGGDEYASIDADIETPLSSQEIHGSSFIWLNTDRYVFDPFRPIQRRDASASYHVRADSSGYTRCDPRTTSQCRPCTCSEVGSRACSSWPAHCK